MSDPKIYVLHENEEWITPLKQALEELNVPYEAWHLDEGTLDLSQTPPEGVFYNRMSASSHTRNHRFAPEFSAAVLSWLEAHHRTVLNKSRALQLEISKMDQYTSLQTFGIQVPKTVGVVGKDHIIEAAKDFPLPFITKHNRAGKGLGVQLFQSVEALERYVYSDEFEEPIDGITLLQEYIESPDSSITRCEFIGGKFYYAVRVDTSEGFELCPAEACRVDDQFCPTTTETSPMFEIIEDFDDPILQKYEQFLQANDIHFAGIEFIRNQEGKIFTYDVNTNTNYNPEAEAAAGRYGMHKVAQTLREALEEDQISVFVSAP